jgi:PAS domain S-box-containing protein
MKSLWELLWDYDPNGLIVVDENMLVMVVNPAFCKMFRTTRDAALGSQVSQVLGDVADLQKVWSSGEAIEGVETEIPEMQLYVKKLIFPVREEGVVAEIIVDLTEEWKQRKEMQMLKQETIQKVHAVVDKQMNVAQKIASLLGETTAETKVRLLELLELVEKER